MTASILKKIKLCNNSEDVGSIEKTLKNVFCKQFHSSSESIIRVIVARKKLKKFIEIDMKALLKLFTRFSKIRNCCSSAKK